MRRVLAALWPGLLLCAGSLVAQEKPRPDDPPEIWLLDEVIGKAVAKVQPAVVTIETFGGMRKQLGGRRPPAPGRPTPPKPPEDDKEKKPDPSDPGNPDKGQDKDGKKKPKPLGPLVMPGFLQAQGPSTGLVVGRDGWIITSRWALNFDPTTILVTLDDGRKFTARVCGEDRSRGLALLRVDADDLPVAELASLDGVAVGQWAFAVARTFASKQPTVHVGTISALRRISGRALQTDASTSPANYGGPLIDLDGRVLGIVSPLSPQGDIAGADWYDSGIGFAVTLADIGDKIEGMKEGKIYQKGLIGVVIDQGYLGPGARLASVERKSAANHANLRQGDVILSVEGEPIRHGMHLQDVLGAHYAGEWLRFEVKKKGGPESEQILVELDPPKG